jgi:hypothetical protein
MNAYEEAKQIVDSIPTHMLYNEQKLEKAQVLATLALSEATVSKGSPDIVYGLVSKKRGDLEGSWYTAALYVDHEAAKTQLQDILSGPDQGYEWSIQPYKLNN